MVVHVPVIHAEEVSFHAHHTAAIAAEEKGLGEDHRYHVGRQACTEQPST